MLGAEMIEANDQQAVNQYLADEIDAEGLDTVATSLWPNHETDYAPLLKLAKDNGLKFIACNVPRKYARLVYRKGLEGLDSLPADEKQWIAPLPIDYDPELPGYKSILEMMSGHGNGHIGKAQAIKDATMAHFILSNYKADDLFIHYNGTYHSENNEGILWYMHQQQPALDCMSISCVLQSDVKFNEAFEGKADYILVVDEEMTTTY